MQNLTYKKNKKHHLQFNVGDQVRIHIPRIDRTGIDRWSLPCKVLEVLDGNLYCLGCAYGILKSCYQISDMESINAEFKELANIPNCQVSLTEAARLQSSAAVQNTICYCKTDCKNNKCSCKWSGVGCGSRCHPCYSKCENQ